jgi:hypothetical protein
MPLNSLAFFQHLENKKVLNFKNLDIKNNRNKNYIFANINAFIEACSWYVSND